MVFCFLLVEDAALLSGFLFFSEFALACSRRRLICPVLASANNRGSMSESVTGEGVLDVTGIDSGVTGGKFACALDSDVEAVGLGAMRILALTRAGNPVVPAEDVGATLKAIMGVYVAASSC